MLAGFLAKFAVDFFDQTALVKIGKITLQTTAPFLFKER
mgnify:CR=1 FL=1